MRVIARALLFLALFAAGSLAAQRYQILIYKDPGYQGDWAPEEDSFGTAVPYWHEGSTYTWVKLDLSSGANEIWVYYGSATAPDRSNGAAVFELFDDFTAKDPQWTWPPSWIVSDGCCEHTFPDGWAEMNCVDISFPVDSQLGYAVRMRLKSGGSVEAYDLFVRLYEGSSYWKTSWAVGQYDLLFVHESEDSWALREEWNEPDTRIWQVAEIVVLDGSQKIFINSTLEDTRDKNTNQLSRICLQPKGTAYWDWLFVRKHLATDPSVTYFPEETGTWEIDGHIYTKRRKVSITSEHDVTGYQIALDYSMWGQPNIRCFDGGSQ